MALYQLKVKQNAHFNMIEMSHQLRNQRERAIQSDIQYLFVHRVVLEILIQERLIELTPELSNFFTEYEQLIIRKKLEMKKN